jgi:hypothetical protein
MFAMMTMHKEWSRFGRKFGKFCDAIGWNAIVSVGQMNITQAVAAGAFHVGFAAVHTDNGFHAKFREGGERGVILGLRAGLNVCGGAKGVMHARNFNRLRGWLGRQNRRRISNRRRSHLADEKGDEENPSPEANINMN